MASGAQAQTAYDYHYAVRLRTTPTGTTATLTRADGEFVYTNVALTPRNCPTTGNPVARRVTSAFEYVAPGRLELRLPTVGSRSCLLVGTFDLAAADDPSEMRDPGPPGQISGAVRERAELEAGLLFGIRPDTAGPWGSTITVSSADAVERVNGVCRFAYAYLVRNIGDIASTPTSNTLEWNGPLSSGSVDDDLPALTVNKKTEIGGLISLKQGLSTVTLYVDAPDLVEEKIEANVYEINVDVVGSCY
jgi:hypothetical protein